MAKILAVDDSRTMRNIISTTLQGEGHDVTTAEDGDVALGIARQETFDLVLSDINMPNMNGISLISKLRRLEGYKNIPIIMVTTEDADYKKTKARNFGANGWLQKPFSQERLLTAVNRLIP